MKKEVIQIRINGKKKKSFKKYAKDNKKKISEIIESDIDKHLQEK